MRPIGEVVREQAPAPAARGFCARIRAAFAALRGESQVTAAQAERDQARAERDQARAETAEVVGIVRDLANEVAPVEQPAQAEQPANPGEPQV